MLTTSVAHSSLPTEAQGHGGLSVREKQLTLPGSGCTGTQLAFSFWKPYVQLNSGLAEPSSWAALVTCARPLAAGKPLSSLGRRLPSLGERSVPGCLP